MINTFLITLLSISLLLLSYGKVKVYYVFIVNFVKNLKESKEKSNNPMKLIETDENDKTDITDEVNKGLFQKIKRVVFNIIKVLLLLIVASLLFAVAIAIFGVVTSKVWVTILLAIYTNFVYTASFLIAINLLFFLIGLGIHKKMKIDDRVTKRALIMDTMQFSMLSLLLYFAAFGYPINIVDIVQVPFHWNITFNNLASILLPTLFFSLITVNILSIVVRMKNIFTKDIDKQWIIRLDQIFFIFITSCFIGIIYITDIDLSFMNEIERTMYLQTLEVVKWVVTSVFIPLFIYMLNNHKNAKDKNKMISNNRNHHFKRLRKKRRMGKK